MSTNRRLDRLAVVYRRESMPGLRAVVEEAAAAHGIDPDELMQEVEAMLAEARRRGEGVNDIVARMAAESGMTVEELLATAEVPPWR